MNIPAGIKAVTDPKDMAAFLTGVRGEVGQSRGVLLPETTEAVAACVQHFNASQTSFVAQSGNTGLVGASVPDSSGQQAVLSLSRLRETFEPDLANRSIRVSTGFRLSEVNDRLAEHGLFFPIDLGSDPMIGGMVATNTGGGRFLRYGDVRSNTLGLTVVLKDGEVVRLGGPVRKDNTGPDWKQLHIGSCGWFGTITEAVLNLEPVVTEQATALVVPSSDAAMLTQLRHLETRVGPLLSAFEFMSKAAMKHTFAHAASLKNPFARGEIPETALLIELSRPTKAPWDTPLDNVLEAVLSEAWQLPETPIEDALFGRPEEIWALRHALSEGVKSAGPLVAFDLGFTRDKVIAFRAEMTRKLAKDFPMMEVCDFGHLGDGGLHFNLVKTDGPVDPKFEMRLRDIVVDHAVNTYGGSFSAEHGIGPKNYRYFEKWNRDTAVSHKSILRLG
ncbi:FAD-binding oxidoreductase [Halocynthiibacter sp. C4]|uniref:FAD-binding oxidoreductase n=1 Tax=Halocynthiibacter sp. C4 TaxID=2992758 RepID=UPI00237BED6A|nr:FAD-binding oxidoreductase [Halocynthiibacter sp. C4]MDE0591303.1 FAD-binding oxidoreductase [Halocynthiibacter sp. C4]